MFDCFLKHCQLIVTRRVKTAREGPNYELTAFWNTVNYELTAFWNTVNSLLWKLCWWEGPNYQSTALWNTVNSLLRGKWKLQWRDLMMSWLLFETLSTGCYEDSESIGHDWGNTSTIYPSMTSHDGVCCFFYGWVTSAETDTCSCAMSTSCQWKVAPRLVMLIFVQRVEVTA